MLQLVLCFLVLLSQVQDQQFLHFEFLSSFSDFVCSHGSLTRHRLSHGSGNLDFF